MSPPLRQQPAEDWTDFHQSLPEFQQGLHQSIDQQSLEAQSLVEIPEFHGTLHLQPDELLEWLEAVEQVLDLKDMPHNIRVPFVATRFRGPASVWWQQVQLKRSQQGREKIASWRKLVKHMRLAFLRGSHDASPSLPSSDKLCLRTNVFRSSCIVNGEECEFIIDSGSEENLISEEVVGGLGLEVEEHPNPYMVGWVLKGLGILVTGRVLVPLSVGDVYKDQIYCDVVPMDTCDILLGRPWQFDRRVIHDGWANTYTFRWHKRQLTLYPRGTCGNC